MSRADDERAAEAGRALRRVDRESETLLGGAARRMGDHFAGRDADGDDAIEIWGRRIGRALSAVLAVALAWLLGWQLGWW